MTVEIAQATKKPATRIYVVEGLAAEGQPQPANRLVRAGHPSQVYMHVAKAQFSVSAASADEVAELMGNGVKVESTVE